MMTIDRWRQSVVNQSVNAMHGAYNNNDNNNNNIGWDTYLQRPAQQPLVGGVPDAGEEAEADLLESGESN